LSTVQKKERKEKGQAHASGDIAGYKEQRRERKRWQDKIQRLTRRKR
jgi:hypothetical protein